MDDWRESVGALTAALYRIDDHQARQRWSCSRTEYIPRLRSFSDDLRAVLARTAADNVTSVVVAAAGGDVLSATAAFPRAELITLLSSEPALPRALRLLTANASAVAALSAIFACSHGGAYLLGSQLRHFANEWGVVPILVVQLALDRMHVTSISSSAGGSRSNSSCSSSVLITACRTEPTTTTRRGFFSFSRTSRASSSCSDALHVRYVQTTLLNAHGIRALFADVARDESSVRSRSSRGRRTCRALLIKGAETVFRGGDLSRRAAQIELSSLLLRHTDVLLQDADYAMRWRELSAWLTPQLSPHNDDNDADADADAVAGEDRAVGTVVPLGSYIGPPEALYPREGPLPPTVASLLHGAAQQELASMRRLWATSRRWRSLHGLRFGYCHSERSLSKQLLVARVPPTEPPARGEDDEVDKGGRFYCAAMLAWRGRGRRRAA